MKKIDGKLSVYTTELVAIWLALEWIKEKKIHNTVIISDSYSVLQSIQSGKSFRGDLINEVYKALFQLELGGIATHFLWVPAHAGVEGNEQVDKLAKMTLKHKEVDLQIPVSKDEVKVLIKNHVKSIWQVYWDDNEKGRHLYNIQKQVDKGRMEGRNRKEENLITRLRIGHTGLNYTLKVIGKHQTGNCDYCSQPETACFISLQTV